MRLYITGGTGLVGSNIIRLARARGDIEVIASQYGPEPEWEVDYALDPLDMADAEAVRASIQRYRPDAVIHCAAILDHVLHGRQSRCRLGGDRGRQSGFRASLRRGRRPLHFRLLRLGLRRPTAAW